MRAPSHIYILPVLGSLVNKGSSNPSCFRYFQLMRAPSHIDILPVSGSSVNKGPLILPVSGIFS